MSFPSGRQRMSKRPAAQKRSSIKDWSASDDDYEATERSAKASNRAKARKSAAVKADPEASADEDAAESDDEQPGPSRRGGGRGTGRSGTQPEQDEEAEPPRRGGARGNTAAKKKKAAARTSRQVDDEDAEAEAAEFLMMGLSGDEEDTPDSEDAGLLQEAMDKYEYAATPASAPDSQLSSGEEGSLVRAVMRFMVFRQQQKPDVPVKREELTKLILSNYKGQRITKLGTRILALAAARFPRALGMEMKEITLRTQTKHGEVEGAKVFLLRSLLPTRLRAFVKEPKVEMNQGFAMVVMPLIALAGGKLSEGDLAAQLDKLGVALDYDHPTLGKPSEQLNELVTKKYLVKNRETTNDGPMNVYAISSVAMEEIGEDNLKAFIEKVFARPSEA